MLRAFAVTVCALVLPGCMTLVSVGAPESEVQRTMGKPAMEFDLPDGSRQLVFPTGPLGTQTFMVYVKDGNVRRAEQVLTDDTFARIQTGVATREDVRRAIGPPYRVVRFDNLRQVAWDYRFRDTWGYLADFSVMVDEKGVVANKVIIRMEPSRDGGGLGR